MTIRVECEVKDRIPEGQLSVFQGNLKTLSEQDLGKIKARILKVGFKYPLFIWKSGEKLEILDGTERLLAVRSLKADGHQVPALPVVYVHAKNRKEAKEEVLHLSSSFGKISRRGLSDFLGASTLDLSTVSLDGLDMTKDIALDRNHGADLEKRTELKPYRYMRVLVSFPPSVLRKIRSHIAAIEKAKGVEVDRSWS